MHHVQNKTLPTPLMKFFDDVKNDLNLDIRSRTRKKLKVPLFKLSRTQKSVKYQRVTLWNSLSLNFKKLSFRKFSTEYKSNLIQSYKLYSYQIVIIYLSYQINSTLVCTISIMSILSLE